MASSPYEMTLGTLLVGIFFNTFLYGLVTYQFAIYYQRKYNDPPLTKYTVFFLFVLDTFHSISVVYMAWCYTVTDFDNPAALNMAQWPYPFTPIATALTALVTQIFLGIRILRFTGSKLLLGVVITLALPTFVMGIGCGVGAWVIWIWSKLSRLTPLVIAWLVMQVSVDLFISGTLILAFYRSRTGSDRIDSVLNRLICCAIQTGLFATIFSMGDLFTFVFLPTTNLYGMFAIPIGRIYTNTLMNTLLCRDSLNANLHATFDVSAAIDAYNWTDTASGSSEGVKDVVDTKSTPVVPVEETLQDVRSLPCYHAQGKAALPKDDRQTCVQNCT